MEKLETLQNGINAINNLLSELGFENELLYQTLTKSQTYLLREYKKAKKEAKQAEINL